MFRARSRSRGGRDARFLWQVLLVVPPVAILSVVSLYSLRQDRASIEQDARRSAAELAADLAKRTGERLSSQIAASQPLSGLILDGHISLPRDYPALPTPPAWLTTLGGADARAWRAIADKAPPADPANLRLALATLARAPAAVRANAEWMLARAEASLDASPRPIKRLADLASRYPDELTESGTPLSDLALLLALQRAPSGGLPASLLSDIERHIVDHPSFLTPAVVEEAVRKAPAEPLVKTLDARWRSNEQALGLLRRLPAGDLPTDGICLDDGEGEPWIALVADLPQPEPSPEGIGPACHVTLVPASVVDRAFRSAVADRSAALPRYASITLRIGGREWRTDDPQAGDPDPQELASADGRFDLTRAVPADAVPGLAEDLKRISPEALSAEKLPGGRVALNVPSASHRFAIGVDLADPDALYASYRRRFWLAMGLILAATAAAFGGLASTWQAFRRQRRLAEMKSNFVASVSHELRAPIAAVRLMAESLERGTIENPERREEYLRVIGQELRRLSSLVENVLDFSRIDQGRTRYSFEPADLSALVSQTIELMGPYAAQRRVGLAASVPAGQVVHPRVDHQALQQALVNLIDNAIKHSASGAEVTIGLEADGGPAQAVRVFVEDSGPGIPAEDHQRIFEPFYRRGSELRRETQGIGIGLNIVKHVAEAHGGRVVVRSSPGEGSRFTIELPPPAEVAS